MALPPGIAYIGRHLHYLVGPPTFVYVVVRVANELFDVHTPLWLSILASLLAFPIALTLWVQYNLYIDTTEAAAHGAVLPPRLPDTSIGGLKTLTTSVAQFKTGYIGEIFDGPFEELGKTINLR